MTDFSSLKKALECLENRLKLVGGALTKIEAKAWKALPRNQQELIPDWLISLLDRYRVSSAVLEFRGKNDDPLRLFAFFSVEDFSVILEEESLTAKLIDFGYFPFANESDGNVWLVKTNKGFSSEVLLLELDSWDGLEPSKDNGLIYATDNIASLVSIMALSEGSFDDVKSPTIMWPSGRL